MYEYNGKTCNRTVSSEAGLGMFGGTARFLPQ